MIKPFISIVSPIYGAENTVEELVSLIHKEVSLITTQYEIILVDDCGPDKSWEKISQLCKKDDSNNKRLILSSINSEVVRILN